MQILESPYPAPAGRWIFQSPSERRRAVGGPQTEFIYAVETAEDVLKSNMIDAGELLLQLVNAAQNVIVIERWVQCTPVCTISKDDFPNRCI